MSGYNEMMAKINAGALLLPVEMSKKLSEMKFEKSLSPLGKYDYFHPMFLDIGKWSRGYVQSECEAFKILVDELRDLAEQKASAIARQDGFDFKSVPYYIPGVFLSDLADEYLKEIFTSYRYEKFFRDHPPTCRAVPMLTVLFAAKIIQTADPKRYKCLYSLTVGCGMKSTETRKHTAIMTVRSSHAEMLSALKLKKPK